MQNKEQITNQFTQTNLLPVYTIWITPKLPYPLKFSQKLKFWYDNGSFWMVQEEIKLFVWKPCSRKILKKPQVNLTRDRKQYD